MTKVTKSQKKHLLALEAGERPSYPGLHLGVLNSLSLKKLVVASFGPGSLMMPHTAVKWRLTDAGRALLPELKS
jgi:hypothetical protein